MIMRHTIKGLSDSGLDNLLNNLNNNHRNDDWDCINNDDDGPVKIITRTREAHETVMKYVNENPFVTCVASEETA